MNIPAEKSIELTIESNRLRFKPLSNEDRLLSVELWTDPEITKYVGGPASEIDLEKDHTKFMRRCAGGAIGVWSLTEISSNEKIGTAILLPMPITLDDTDWDLVTGCELPDASIEVGYILKKSAWGKGYATEACRKLIDFGFENTALDEIVASIDHDNNASRNVLLKSGLQYEGEQLSYNELCPFFRITRTQWNTQNNDS